MSESREFFDAAMKAKMDAHYNEVVLDAPWMHTIGALVSAVMAIEEDEDARRFFEGYFLWQTEHGRDGDDPGEVVRSNIGWCFGEGMARAQVEMWQRVCGAAHPIFGSAIPTAEEAVEAGKRAALQ